MVFSYYPESDMLYIELTKGVSVESEEVAPNIVLDFNEEGRVIGIEIEDASKAVDINSLEFFALPLVKLAMDKAAVPVSS